MKTEQMFGIIKQEDRGQMDEQHKYDEIIDMPHHVSATRRHMTMTERAAQFAPFAALTGPDKQVEETAEIARERMEYRDVERIDEV